MSIETVVDNIASTAGIDQQSAEKAAGIIFSVIRHEAPELASQLFTKVPGADELASANDVLAPQHLADEGILGAISGVIGGLVGEKAGALVSGFAALETSGLSVEQIRHAGAQVIGHAREKDPDLVANIIGRIPGLKSHFGL